MSKTEDIKQVTKIKNPKRVAVSTKSYQERMLKRDKEILEKYEERMLKMKKEIFENTGSNDTNDSNGISISSNDTNDSNGISSNDTNNSNGLSINGTNTVKSNNDVYFYGIEEVYQY